MKWQAFATRNRKEILRDPLNLAFGIGFPLATLILMSAIQANIPVSLFEIQKLAPGVAVFGLSFFALLGGMLIAKDRVNSYLLRLFASPLTATDFLLGYIIPLLPMAIAQSLICFGAAFIFKLELTIDLLYALLTLIPTAFLFIAIGLLTGSIFNDKQVGGICGALLTNLSAWLSGIWFDLNLVGGGFETLAYLLPFAHAVDATRAALNGMYSEIFPHLLWVFIYGAVLLGIAIIVFKRQMKK